MGRAGCTASHPLSLSLSLSLYPALLFVALLSLPLSLSRHHCVRGSFPLLSPSASRNRREPLDPPPVTRPHLGIAPLPLSSLSLSALLSLGPTPVIPRHLDIDPLPLSLLCPSPLLFLCHYCRGGESAPQWADPHGAVKLLSNISLSLSHSPSLSLSLSRAGSLDVLDATHFQLRRGCF